jgi:hypothetical protein
MLQPLSATSRAMKIGITSEKLNGMQQSMIAYWTIRQRLLRVPGVANVPIWGERLEMLNVNVDRKRMAAEGVTLDQVMTTTGDALEAGLLQFSDGALIGTGGFVETPNERTGIRHKLSIESADDLAKVVIQPRGEGREPLRLRDVADVVTDHQPMIGDAVINSGPGLMLIVEKLPWANTLDVTKGVEEAVRLLQPGLPDLEIDTTIFRPATFIETSLKNLSTTLLIGCLLMILMLFLFLYEWRVALISVVAIPLSLIAAAMVLAWQGTTINTMILAGFAIALGDVVDDAIIVVTADHGEEFFEHGGWWHGTTPYEEQIRVPLLVKLAGGARAGSRVPGQVRQVDLAPTLVDLAGFEKHPSWQGDDLFTDSFDADLLLSTPPPVEPPDEGAPLAPDGTPTAPGAAPPWVAPDWSNHPASRDALSEQDYEGYDLQSLRRRGKKMIQALRVPAGNARNQAPVQYYDLVADPLEASNLAGSGSGDEAALKAALEGMVEDRKSNSVGAEAHQMDDAERSRLCSLGYLSGDECLGAADDGGKAVPAPE